MRRRLGLDTSVMFQLPEHLMEDTSAEMTVVPPTFPALPRDLPTIAEDTVSLSIVSPTTPVKDIKDFAAAAAAAATQQNAITTTTATNAAAIKTTTITSTPADIATATAKNADHDSCNNHLAATTTTTATLTITYNATTLNKAMDDHA